MRIRPKSFLKYIFLLLTFYARGQNASATDVSANVLEASTISTPSPSLGIYLGGNAEFHSGLTLQGDGHATSESSATASSFFGDGGQLGTVASLRSTQTFTGSAIFSSTVSIQTGGREIALSTGNTANIKVASDGQTSFFPELHNSIYTAIPQATTSATTFGPCIAGSTLTLTTTGNAVEVRFTGILRNNALGSTATMTLLEDGNFLPGLSNTKGIVKSNFTASEGAYDVGPFAYLLEPSAGQHSYCLSLGAPNGGTAELGETTSDFRSFLFIQELK